LYNYPKNIYTAVRAERQDFLDNSIEIVDGLLFNQYNTIKKIHKYYNSHYDLGDYEEINGVQRKKVFFNINKWRCDVATKMLDLDVKDMKLVPLNPATEFNVNLLEKELKAWLKRHRMGKVLNEVVRLLPIYGSVVLRKTKGGADVVDLRKLINDQAAKTLAKGRYTIIKHEMSASDLREMAGIWQNVDEVIYKFCSHTTQSYEDSETYKQAQGSPFAEVYERFAEVPRNWLKGEFYEDGQASDFVLARFIVAGIDSYQKDEQGKVIAEDGVILFSEEIDELPFKEVHYNKTEGRWLGIGVVEDVFEDQRRTNEIKDDEAKGLELGNAILLQTRDHTAAKNLLSDVESGDILQTRQPLERVDMTNKAAAENKIAADAYDQHADRMTFSYDVIRGEGADSSATLGAVQIQTQQANSVYDYKRENIGLFLQEFIEDLVYPELRRILNKPHTFRLTGSIDEMERCRERLFDYYAAKTLDEGRYPASPEEFEAEKQRVMAMLRKMGSHLWVDVEKDFFGNAEYHVSLEPTAEGIDLQGQSNNAMSFFGLFAKNPALLQNPVLRRILFKVMSAIGMSTSELENAQAEINSAPVAAVSPGSQQTLNPQQNAQPVPGGAKVPLQPVSIS
jgi:hypothetical protein